MQRTLWPLAFPILLACFALADPAGQAPDRAEEFQKKFEEARKIEDPALMAKVVRTYQNEAHLRVVWLCERAPGNGLDPAQKKEIGALNSAWRAGMKSEFVDLMYAYFSQMSEGARHDWIPLNNELDDLSATLELAIQEKRTEGWDELGSTFEDAARRFEVLSDHHNAAIAWQQSASCFDEPLRGNQDTLKIAFSNYDAAVKHYDQVQLNTAPVQDVKARRNFLRDHVATGKQGDVDKPKEGEGGAQDPPAGEKPQEPSPPAEEDKPGTLKAQLAFQLIPSVDAIERPFFHCDDIYQLWRPLVFKGDGSEAVLDTQAKPPKFKRLTSAKFAVDGDADGQTERDVQITGNVTAVSMSIDAGEGRRDWGFLCMVGREKDQYQGLELNSSPTKDLLVVYMLSAASYQGELGGTPVRIIDEDMNGIYGNWPQAFGEIGLSEKSYQPLMDSIVVGPGKRARPWSEYIELGGTWYRLETEDFGRSIKAFPTDFELGTIKLDYKGPVDPTWIVLRGSGRFENTFIDIAGPESKKGMVIPTGDWTLYWGELRKGKKMQVQKCCILPGADTIPWVVKEKKETVVKLGEPFGFDFQHDLGEEAVTVKGRSVVVTGVAAERYERSWNCMTHPEASWRKAGAKKASKPEKLPFVLDLDGLEKSGNDWAVLWFPLDVALPIKEKVEKIEVQLTEKKHKLFGAIESIWR